MVSYWVTKDVHQAVGPSEQGYRQYQVEYLVHGQTNVPELFHVRLACLRRAFGELSGKVENRLVARVQFRILAGLEDAFYHGFVFGQPVVSV